MKTLLLGLVMLVACVGSNAQTQEIQQLKLDLEKLAQFKLILSQMKQGYQVLQNGYNAVRDAAKGNFDLHKTYLDGLLTVSPAVRQSPALQEIASNQSAMVKLYQTSFAQYRSSGMFSANELGSLRDRYNECVQKVNDDLDVLTEVMRSGVLRMNDAERLQVIDVVRSDVTDQLSAVRGMVSDHLRLMSLRLQQRKDNNAVKRLSGLK